MPVNRSTSTRQIPDWMLAAGKENYEFGRTLTSQPYSPYGAPRVAAPSADTLSAYSGVRENVGAYRPGLKAAGESAAAGARPLSSMNLDAYMNPFVQGVIEPTTREIRRQGQIARKGINARATRAGAYGSDRHGVVESEQRRNEGQLIADIVAKLQMENFYNAEQMATTDRRLALTAAPTMANIAGQESRYGYEDAARLGTIGAQQEGRTQIGLDLAYQDWLRQQRYPYEQLDTRMDLLARQPYEGKTVTETATPDANPWAQAIGAGAGLWALSSLWRD